MRELKYSQAICEALDHMLAADSSVFLIGQGLDSPWSVGSTTKGLIQKYGDKRCIDTPIAENGVTGTAIGAAMAGMRPVVIHPRMDFMYYAMDQIVNHAANWYYMFNGKVNVPITIRAIINRGNEQASQHSQSTQALFTHIPGIKVVMPSTPYDAKGLMIAAIQDENPVMYIDDRWLYDCVGEVPEGVYSVPLGKGRCCREGSDVTVVATSFMVKEALEAAQELEKEGVSIEVIDVRSLKPLDEDLICSSVKKTGRLLVADAAWRTCGFAAEVTAVVTENVFEYLKTSPRRVTLPDTPVPASSALEKAYFINSKSIISAVREMMFQNVKGDSR
ncbi:MAG: alpha-ketoacid dehydrogenase subunit beta [Desulfobacteraceae bacterium]|nr:alpha-ketoacid dehydrogenase subunit beta [Desulfobacteraceae bacterium]